MNVRCGKGHQVHAAGRHVLNPEYVQTRCGYVGTSTSHYQPWIVQPWIVETHEPVTCRKCLKASNQDTKDDK